MNRVRLSALIAGAFVSAAALSGCQLAGGSSEGKIPSGYHPVCIERKPMNMVPDSKCAGLDKVKGGANATGHMWVWVAKDVAYAEGEVVTGSVWYGGDTIPGQGK